MFEAKYVQYEHAGLGVLTVDVRHPYFTSAGGLLQRCPDLNSLDGMVLGSGGPFLAVPHANPPGTAIVGLACSTIVLCEGTDESIIPMVHPPEESGLYVFVIFDPWDFCKHRPNEHHGGFTITASFPGAP